MDDLSGTARVILGMIKLGRRTGYDIKALVDKSSRYFWAASYGQIYPELRRLEEAGLIRGEDDPSDGRRRRTYSLTEAGEAALHEWLAASDPLTYELRDEGLLKLFFSDAMSAGETLAHLRAMRGVHEEIVERLREIEPFAAASENHGPYTVLQGGLALHGFIADWCRDLEQAIEAGESPTEAAARRNLAEETPG